ncbi:hypothetical protein HMPREF1990_02046 [Porphyromonas gingivalis W4087]|nr:hypothetical protein HMPREF1990_02046 [Porphyromonas gingivalis W4087]
MQATDFGGCARLLSRRAFFAAELVSCSKKHSLLFASPAQINLFSDRNRGKAEEE